jgi:hypothetical protein
MKKSVFTVFLTCFTVVNSFSQGTGFATLSGMSGISSIWSGSDSKSDIIGFGVDLRAGYRFKSNFQLCTGISYLKTGFTNNFDYILTNNTESGYYESYKFTHLLVPVELGYAFRLGDKFSLIPSVNIGVSHLLSGTYFVQTDYVYEKKFDTQQLNSYCSFTIWAGAGLHLTYEVSDKIGLIAGNQFNSMVSDFWKISSSGLGDQKMYILSGDIGIRYNF